jgi:SAM-dependent methyltransferase
MAEMNRFGRWLVDRRTDSRGRRVLARLGPNLDLARDARVLELGSGGGGLLALLQERFRPARLVGTDYDPVQVNAVRAFLAARWGSLPASLEVQEADALALPYPDGSFDWVFAMMMLHHVETHHREYVRRPQALREIRRVLRPAGSLVYSEMFGRAEIRRTLAELGFEQRFLRAGWRSDLGIFRSPMLAPAAGPPTP